MKSERKKEGYMRRILSILLTIALVMSFASVAIADDEVGSLTITKFVVDRLSSTNAFGTNDGSEFTGDLSAFTPLEGVGFTVVRVEPCAVGTPGAIYNAQHGDWYLAVAAPVTVSTNASGVAKFADLPLGVYYVVENPTAAGVAPTDPAAPFFVSIPTILQSTGQADQYLYDVFVYPKNEDIGITKEIVPPSVVNDNATTMGAGLGYGDTIHYKLTVDVPSDIAAYQMFKVTDYFDVGLRYTGLVSVTAKGHASAADLAPLAHDEEVKTLGGTVVTDYSADGGTVVFDFDAAEFDLLTGYTRIEIVLAFTITTNASLNVSIDNKASLDVTNRYGDDKHRETEIPKVYTGGIKILKHDSVIGDLGLQGAEFVLVPVVSGTYDDDKGTVNPATGIPSTAYKNADGTTVVIGVSDADGLVQFKGIAYGKVTGGVFAPTGTEYWLVEIKAPTGYRIPGGDPLKITIDGNSWKAAATALESEVKVGNVKGFNFPLTGGAGTVAFLAAGIALATISYGLYRLSRREREALS
jgi:fimbrial isopeptide formation D2 family protein